MQKPPFYIRQLRPGIEAATDALGQERYKQSYEQGQAMSVEKATEFLLGDSSSPVSRARDQSATT